MRPSLPRAVETLRLVDATLMACKERYYRMLSDNCLHQLSSWVVKCDVMLFRHAKLVMWPLTCSEMASAGWCTPSRRTSAGSSMTLLERCVSWPTAAYHIMERGGGLCRTWP